MLGRRIRSGLGVKLAPYLFISPFFLLYGFFMGYPIVYGFWLSLVEIWWDEVEFVGFRNYELVVTDDRFWKSISNAIYYLGGSVFVIVPAALLIALLLNHRTIERAKGFVSTLLFTPNVTSVIVTSIIFNYLLRRRGGVINSILEAFDLGPIAFLLDPVWAIPSLILLGLWTYVGVNALYFLAGLQGIPPELHEAARIDGASPLQDFLYVTLPMLRPIAVFVVFTAIVGSFNLFGEPFVLGGGTGTQNSMLMPTVLLYMTAFRSMDFGYAAAIGWTLTAIIFLFTLIQLRVFRGRYGGADG